MMGTIKSKKSEGNYILGMCVDVEKAYDCVSVEKLAIGMFGMGFNSHVIQWILDFNKKRQLILGSHTVEISNGLAQGSSLSPTLFNLYTRNLHGINDEDTTLFQFADDFFILVYNRNFAAAESRLRQKIVEFRNGCEALNLRFNMSKTNIVHFSNRPRNLQMNIDGTDLNQDNKIKFLGMMITPNGSMGDHIDRTIAAVDRKCNFLKILSGCTFGIDPTRSLHFYRAFARSKIEYGAAVLSNLTKTSDKKLTRCQNNFLRKSLGLIRSTNTIILYHMAAELPPVRRFEFATAKELVKSAAYGLPGIEAVRGNTLAIDDIGRTKIRSGPSGKIRLNNDFFGNTARKKSEASPQVIKTLFNVKMESLKEGNFQIFFTDGSIMAGTTGYAFLHHESGLIKKFRTLKKFSSMSAELLAFKKTMEFAIQSDYKKIAILTDSLSGMMALSGSSHKNFIIDDIKLLAEEFESPIEFYFIPSHCNIPPNETVDTAAREACISGIPSEEKWTIKDAITRIEEQLWNEWSAEYAAIAVRADSHYFKIFPNTLRRPWFDGKGLYPAIVKTLNRILSNHCFCKSTLADMGVFDTNECERCGVAETANHIIFQCDKYLMQRRHYPFIEQCSTLDEFVALYGLEELVIIHDLLSEINIRL
ncbi:uncharacterized protein LOC142224915 [Haematobia irritans]|uniref:uncharacterized protein LOC142224915 n=1 Tax=Haematobia irritans TaxID=7368 RepID=UPI003F4F64AB